MRAMLAAVSRRAVQTNQRLLADQPGAARGPLSPASTGRIYPVFSPRGGSGKTTLAVRLATRLAELSPQRVALLDLDLFSDDAALQLNLTPAASLASIREAELAGLDPRSLGNYLVEHESRLRVLVGATSPEEGERVTGAHVRAALAALRRQFLVTIVDCGSTFSEPTLAALEAGDRVLVVCTPELATLRDVRDCQRIFGQALHIDKTKLAYIFNHPLPAAGLTRVQFEAALEQPMSHEIPHAGELASKPVFAKAVGQLVAELRPPESAADGTSGGTTDRKGRARPARAGLLRLWGAHAR
jgi:pilus assembly protein CpaE